MEVLRSLLERYPALRDQESRLQQAGEQPPETGAQGQHGDEQAARCKFAQYRKCTNVYRDCLKKYNSFDRLVVAVS